MLHCQIRNYHASKKWSLSLSSHNLVPSYQTESIPSPAASRKKPVPGRASAGAKSLLILCIAELSQHCSGLLYRGSETTVMYLKEGSWCMPFPGRQSWRILLALGTEKAAVGNESTRLCPSNSQLHSFSRAGCAPYLHWVYPIALRVGISE